MKVMLAYLHQELLFDNAQQYATWLRGLQTGKRKDVELLKITTLADGRIIVVCHSQYNNVPMPRFKEVTS